MDHFCPWVGGPVGESNMKFFIQFNAYTALYCLHLLVVMAIYVAKQKSSKVRSHFLIDSVAKSRAIIQVGRLTGGPLDREHSD